MRVDYLVSVYVCRVCVRAKAYVAVSVRMRMHVCMRMRACVYAYACMRVYDGCRFVTGVCQSPTCVLIYSDERRDKREASREKSEVREESREKSEVSEERGA